MTPENKRYLPALDNAKVPITQNYRPELNNLVGDHRDVISYDETNCNITFATVKGLTSDNQIIALTPNGIFLFQLQPDQDPTTFIQGHGRQILKAAATSPLNHFCYYGEPASFQQDPIQLEYTAYPLENENLIKMEIFLDQLDNVRQSQP